MGTANIIGFGCVGWGKRKGPFFVQNNSRTRNIFVRKRSSIMNPLYQSVLPNHNNIPVS